MSDLEIRQRLQASTYGEGRQLVKWINSIEVVDRLSDPALGHCPCGTTILQSGPWVVCRGVSLNTNAMTAGIVVSERNDEFTVLGLAIRHPSFRTSLPSLDPHLYAPPRLIIYFNYHLI